MASPLTRSQRFSSMLGWMRGDAGTWPRLGVAMLLCTQALRSPLAGCMRKTDVALHVPQPSILFCSTNSRGRVQLLNATATAAKGSQRTAATAAAAELANTAASCLSCLSCLSREQLSA
jgi:hypothetical protein